MDEHDSALAKKYHAIKNRLFFVNLALNIIFLALFFFSGLSVYLRKQFTSAFANVFWINSFYVLVFFLVFYILNFPLDMYEGLILEHKFKLSRQNLSNWLKDDLKRSGLELILGLILVLAVYFFLSKFANSWWLFAACFWIFLTLVLAKITPSLIIPIFYKYLPITDAELKEKIISLFEKCKIKIKDVSSINFSQKTKKANAFVCGLGKSKKVVLSDTLLKDFSHEEIEAVLAHELGHYLNHDVLKLILINSACAFLGFYLIDRLLKNLLLLFGLNSISDIAFLPIIALVLTLLGFIILPLQNGFSRFLERRADIFSLQLTKNKNSFISMMKKLGRMNLADLNPNRFIEIWLYDHPPISQRIKFAQNFKLNFVIFALIFLSVTDVFAFENIRYEINCNLDAKKHFISASEKVTFVNNSDELLKEIFFHIYPHRKYTNEEIEFMYRFAGYFKVNPYPEGFQSGELKIKSVKQESSALSYSFEGEDQTILKINLLRPLLANQAIELNLDFELEIPHAYGRFGWHENIIALMRWYPILSVFDQQGWHNYPFYPYHQPFFSEASYYKVKLTLDKNQTVIHTGILKTEINTFPSEKTLLIETELPVRDFSLAISPDYRVLTKMQDNVKINSFYLKGDEFYAQKALEFSADLMKSYSKDFAAYPYKEFSIAPVYLGFGGDQTSNLIFIDTRVYKLPRFLIRYFDFLIIHETGHQWFYNLVGSDEYKEMWLDEGLNSYFILNYLEEKYGKDGFVMELPEYFNWFIPNFTFRRARDSRYIFLAKNGWDRPVLGELSSFKEPSSIFALTYGKGAMILSMLNSLVGQDTFERIFQRYFSEFKFKNIKVEDLIRITNEESRKNLTWFFEEWLKTDKKCDYAVMEVKDNKITLFNRGSIEMPVKTKIELSDASAIEDSWDGKGKFKEIKLKEGSRVIKVKLDPAKTLLDIDFTNNLWPRSFYKVAVPIYYGVYEYPLFLPDDSYNFVFGPEINNGGLGLKASLQKPFDNIVYLSSDYVFNRPQVKTTLGYELKHVFNKQQTAGFELFNNVGLRDKTDNLYGGKLYFRRQLWPASYGLTEIEDHITFYILRNRRFDGGASSGGPEDVRNLSYLKNDEAIIGTTFYLNRSGPYFSPERGYKFSATVENAEHFLGGKEYFWREMFDAEFYKSIFKKGQFATRIKFGWGSPSDKNLYQLGGNDGLRGFDLKTVRGSRTMLASLEYRFPLLRDLDYHFMDNILGIDELQGVLFFDVGKSWYNSFREAKFKKDAGFGLRVHFNFCSFLERAVLRLDIAEPIDAPQEKARVWVGLNQAF